jgi:hypothetical protein
VAALAQFIDRGNHVEVKKRTMLCLNNKMEKAKGALDPEKAFWQITSNRRANDTQTVTAIEYETLYDRKSGDTTIKEHRYDEDYAMFFKRDPEHKGMLLMISPQDGRVEAIVQVCEKK